MLGVPFVPPSTPPTPVAPTSIVAPITIVFAANNATGIEPANVHVFAGASVHDFAVNTPAPSTISQPMPFLMPVPAGRKSVFIMRMRPVLASKLSLSSATSADAPSSIIAVRPFDGFSCMQCGSPVGEQPFAHAIICVQSNSMSSMHDATHSSGGASASVPGFSHVSSGPHTRPSGHSPFVPHGAPACGAGL
jgi:hypothetical protein